MELQQPSNLKPSDQQELIHHLFGIIDSKIQYIDYQMEIVTSSFVDLSTLGFHSLRNTSNGQESSVTKSVMANNRRILDKISEYSATTKLLLVLRSHLDTTNAELVLDLLTDNRFTQLTDKELEHQLNKNREEES